MHTLTDQEHELLAAGNDHIDRWTQTALDVAWYGKTTDFQQVNTDGMEERHWPVRLDWGISGDALALARHNGRCWPREQQ